jgi:hypothetical protein
MSCTWIPPLVEQLHGPDPTSGSDCAIACAAMAIRFATCDAVNPGIDKVREMAGLDQPNPPPDDYSTTMTEYAKAVNAFDQRAYEAGYEGIAANVHEREPWEAGDSGLAPAIRDESKWITVFVDYGVVNDREPDKTGDKDFGGSHAVSVFGYKSKAETDAGVPKVKVFDPLCDGRRSDIPKGPVWWQMSTLRDAADAYAGGGSGNATWCATPRSKLTAPTPPPDPAPEPCAEAMAARTLVGAAAALLAWALRELEAANSGNPDAEGITIHSGVKPGDA